MNSVANDDDQETTLQSGHREWAEAWEREQQVRDERVVQQFLAAQAEKSLTLHRRCLNSRIITAIIAGKAVPT